MDQIGGIDGWLSFQVESTGKFTRRDRLKQQCHVHIVIDSLHNYANDFEKERTISREDLKETKKELFNKTGARRNIQSVYRRFCKLWSEKHPHFNKYKSCLEKTEARKRQQKNSDPVQIVSILLVEKWEAGYKFSMF